MVMAIMAISASWVMAIPQRNDEASVRLFGLGEIVAKSPRKSFDQIFERNKRALWMAQTLIPQYQENNR